MNVIGTTANRPVLFTYDSGNLIAGGTIQITVKSTDGTVIKESHYNLTVLEKRDDNSLIKADYNNTLLTLSPSTDYIQIIVQSTIEFTVQRISVDSNGRPLFQQQTTLTAGYDPVLLFTVLGLFSLVTILRKRNSKL